jgi:hypothetical protein
MDAAKQRTADPVSERDIPKIPLEFQLYKAEKNRPARDPSPDMRIGLNPIAIKGGGIYELFGHIEQIFPDPFPRLRSTTTPNACVGFGLHTTPSRV